MKLYRYLIILLAIIDIAWAQEDAFSIGNKAYENAQYEQAIVQYNKLVKKGIEDQYLYYNLGNAYYQTEQVALSILYLEKAQKLAPSNKKIKHNLHLAYLKTKNQIEPLPNLFFVQWWYSYLTLNSASNWGKIAVLFAWISVALFIAFLFLKKNWFKNIAWLCLILAFCFAFTAYQKNNYSNNKEMAIVMQEAIELKKSPNDNAETIKKLDAGLKVKIKDQVDVWSLIEVDIDNTAWVKTRNLSII